MANRSIESQRPTKKLKFKTYEFVNSGEISEDANDIQIATLVPVISTFSANSNVQALPIYYGQKTTIGNVSKYYNSNCFRKRTNLPNR